MKNAFIFTPNNSNKKIPKIPKNPRDTRAVVISTPKAIKSFYLKFIELLHDIDKANRGAATTLPIAEMKMQAEECVKVNISYRSKCIMDMYFLIFKPFFFQVISLWRESSLMLDEVDLILHPLKSELNYPVGMKVSCAFYYDNSYYSCDCCSHYINSSKPLLTPL